MQAGLAGALGHGRGPAARPDVGLRRDRQRRRPRPAADDPRDPRARTGRSSGRRPSRSGTQAAISPQAAFLVTDILAGNTDKRQNPIWSAKLARLQRQGRQPASGGGQDGHRERRPRPRDVRLPRRRAPTTVRRSRSASGWATATTRTRARREPAISLTAAAPLWHAFVRDYTKGWPVTDFRRPKGVVRATIDAWSGGKPGPWTRDTTSDWFIAGTQPGARKAIDLDGLLYSQACGSWRVDPLKAELGPSGWDADVADWMRRARGGPGRTGQYDSRTAYFWSGASWGGPIAGPCGQALSSATGTTRSRRTARSRQDEPRSRRSRRHRRR